jgi:hypothetical protein
LEEVEETMRLWLKGRKRDIISGTIGSIVAVIIWIVLLDVSEKVLSKTSRSIARYIAANVWKNGGDMRDVISIGKLVRKSDGPQEIELIIKTMMKYGVDGRENDC